MSLRFGAHVQESQRPEFFRSLPTLRPRFASKRKDFPRKFPFRPPSILKRCSGTFFVLFTIVHFEGAACAMLECKCSGCRKVYSRPKWSLRSGQLDIVCTNEFVPRSME